jgi:hypothetical protein
MRHWKTEINFEAWDAEDAARMVQRMIGTIDAESRLLYATTAVETFEMVDESKLPAVRPAEWMGEKDLLEGSPSPE